MEKPEGRVFEIVEENRDQMIRHLQELVRVDTQTPPGHDYDKVCGLMAEKLGGLGCEVTIHEATEKYMELSGARLMGLEGPRSNVVAMLKGSGKGPTLHISAHIDTAAIQKEGWTKDPLGGEVTKTTTYSKSPYDKGGGYIWGRGVSDDKGEATAMTYALQAILEAGVKLKGNLILTGNCDEEIGGVAGLGYLIREEIVKADYGIQLDGGLNGIGLAAQGRTRFLVRTHGRSYHGQIPILGVNAIEKMSKINVALNDYWRNVLLKRQVPVPGIELPEDLRKVGVSSLTAMLNIGTIRGGVQGATVPDLCEEETLRGMVPGETFDEVKKEFISVIEGVKATDADLRYDVEVINAREGYVVPATDPYALKAQAIIAEVVGRKLPFTGTLASTDMNYQVVDGGMPCVNFGVGGPYCNGHRQDENASIDEIIDCTKATALMMMRVLGTV
ncbi:M20/M25/M40 family metallo-hydrolase, partial [Candidatus Bathyarchaeota archaeon]|nr:M20/M25/M40 family metallo-hydrolase [Candidatus Bathyarchaeota archaeon]